MEKMRETGSQKNIYLIGFMGCGKSTVSQWLEKEYGREQIEMDLEIEKNEKMKISRIFEEKGEEYFRNLETSLLKEFSRKDNLVISCGGGVPMRECNVQEMKKNGKIVLLLAEPQTVYDRVKDSHERPLLEGNMSVGYIAGLMEKRREKYMEAADITVRTDDRSVQDICREIMEKV